jgi:predicted lipid-binding transport protein (Tim44 family)
MATPISLISPQVKLAATKSAACAPTVQFGHTPEPPAAGGDSVDLNPPTSAAEAKDAAPSRGFFSKLWDGTMNAIARSSTLGYVELAVDVAAIAGAFFTGGLSLGLMVPGLINKAVKFYQGFANGRAAAAEAPAE